MPISVSASSNSRLSVVAATVRESYEHLWAELTAEEVFAPGEGHRLEERLRVRTDVVVLPPGLATASGGRQGEACRKEGS